MGFLGGCALSENLAIFGDGAGDMDFIVSVGFIAACIGTWRWSALRLGRKGYGWFVRHFMGSCAGVLAGILVVASAIALGVIAPKEKEPVQAVQKAVSDPAVLANVEAPDVTVEQSVAVEKIKSLEVTPSVYVARLNKIFKRVNVKYRAHAEGVVEGPVHNVLKIPLGKYTVLIVAVSKVNGHVTEVTVIGSGDGTRISGMEILRIASAALAAAAPAAEFRDVFRGMPEMFAGKEHIYGSVKLSVQKIDGMGAWFFASPM